MENNQQSVISQIYGKDGTEILIGTRRPKKFRILCVTPQTNSTKPIAFLCPVRYNNKIVIRQNMSIGKKKDKRRQES